MKKSTPAVRSAANSSKTYCPEAGDIVWLNLSPTAGHEQSGRRPVLVLSPQAYNRATRFCVVCAMTTRVKGFPFEVSMPDGAVVLADQVRTVSWEGRGSQLKGRAPEEAVAHVRAKLKALLAIP